MTQTRSYDATFTPLSSHASPQLPSDQKASHHENVGLRQQRCHDQNHFERKERLRVSQDKSSQADQQTHRESSVEIKKERYLVSKE